jgi:hypothetical protein
VNVLKKLAEANRTMEQQVRANRVAQEDARTVKVVNNVPNFAAGPTIRKWVGRGYVLSSDQVHTFGKHTLVFTKEAGPSPVDVQIERAEAAAYQESILGAKKTREASAIIAEQANDTPADVQARMEKSKQNYLRMKEAGEV